MKKLKQLAHGQGLVEFALILPLLLMIVVGILEFGRIFVIYSSLYNAVREGTRYGITNPRDYEGIRGRAQEYVILVAESDPDFNLWVQYDAGPDQDPHTDYMAVAPGDRVLVRVQYPVRPLTPLFDPLVGAILLDTQAARTIQSVGTIITTPPPEGPVPPGGGDPAPAPAPPGDGGGEATPTPTGPYFTTSQTCYPAGTQTIILYGYNWPVGKYIQVFYDGGTNPVIRDYGKLGSPNFTTSFVVNVTEGTHTIRIDSTNQKHPDAAVTTYSRTFVSPCPEATPTPTPDPSNPTPTPVPINIDKPVLAGATTVAGYAQGGNMVTLRVVQSGYQQSVAVAGNNRFTFSGVPALPAGYTILVQGYGQQDLAVVQAQANPTPTPVPTGPYFTLNQVCYPTGNQTFVLSAYNWPIGNYIQVFYDDGPTPVIQDHGKIGTANFTLDFARNITAGTHTIRMDATDKKHPDVALATYSVTFDAPCYVAPTPTPTPLARPDLIITNLEFKEPFTDGTYAPIYVSVAVKNDSDVAVSSLFWVDLYDTTEPTTRTLSVDYVAIAGLPARETITFTMYVLEGFSTVGTHVLMAEVDRYNIILESDDTNNTSEVLTVTLTVANPAPEPTPTPLPGTGVIDGFTYLTQTLQSNVFVVVMDAIGRPAGSTFSDITGYYLISGLAACTTDAPCYSVEGSLRLGDTRYEDLKIASPGDTVELLLKAVGY